MAFYNVGGRPSSDVWQYFEKNTSKSKGHYTAKCRYCLKFWRRGIPDKLEAHLALKCEKVDREISQIYLKKLATKNSVSDVESEDKMSINIEKTMFYVPKKNNDIDFSSVANSETVIDGLDLEEEESFTSLELEEDLSDVSDNNIDNNNLSIESIIDLSVLISGSDISAQDITSDITSPFAEGITDYNPHELVANLVTEDE
ncbi:3177_t:CDS:2 [Entrophospora sp. SA101]|nr:12790_t:CDS:2 [Entrophospora sp. SA101]CAJ0859072.1 13232_t:CDS:2 [Entrophospora sp. SA101]CAJ0922751.1 3177_t:CDS:2 [Entrophospora sp. SA101]